MALDTEVGGETADAYDDVEAWKAWADALGYDYTASPDDPIEQAIRRGTLALDGLYRGRWKGTKTYPGQARDWPRSGVVDEDGQDVAEDEIPRKIIDASFEAARRELAVPGSMQPDLERGGGIKRDRRKVDVLEKEIEYFDGASATTVWTAIDNMLVGYLTSASVSFLMRA